jgi:hypothetical protein
VYTTALLIGVTLKSEVFEGDSELSAKGLHDLSRQTIMRSEARQLCEVIGVAPEIDHFGAPEAR